MYVCIGLYISSERKSSTMPQFIFCICKYNKVVTTLVLIDTRNDTMALECCDWRGMSGEQGEYEMWLIVCSANTTNTGPAY